MKCCKIICFCFREKRQIGSNSYIPLDLQYSAFHKIIENEINSDSGVEMDTIIVNNDSGDKRGAKLCKSIHKLKTKSGRLLLMTRRNEGLSFGAFSHAYKHFKKDYNYWLFNEDDIFIHAENYYPGAISMLSNDPTIGFCALAPIAPGELAHCGGGFGITSSLNLEKMCKIFGDIAAVPECYTCHNKSDRYPSFNGHRCYCEEGYGVTGRDLQIGEIYFTNKFVRTGYQLKYHPNFSPVASNFKHIIAHERIYHEMMKDNPIAASKPFLYQVGGFI